MIHKKEITPGTPIYFIDVDRATFEPVYRRAWFVREGKGKYFRCRNIYTGDEWDSTRSTWFVNPLEALEGFILLSLNIAHKLDDKETVEQLAEVTFKAVKLCVRLFASRFFDTGEDNELAPKE